jgi:hypothetical protein
MTDATPGLELAALIDAVRSEMQMAAARGRGQALQFEVQEVNLDVEIAATVAKEANGGIKIWVLMAGGKATKADAATHRINVKMTAIDEEGNRFQIADTAKRLAPRT